MLNGAAIAWNSKKQRTVALSTVEAEYIALSSTSREAVWLQALSNDVFSEYMNNGVLIHCDNSSAISLSKNHNVNQRTKHIDIRYHFIRELQKTKSLTIKYIATDEMVTDILIKPLPKPKHCKLVDKLGLSSH